MACYHTEQHGYEESKAETTVNEFRESTATTAPLWADCQISHDCLEGFHKTHLGYLSATTKRWMYELS